MDKPSALLRALPFQLISGTAGVILKRGCTELAVEGENAGLVVQLLLDRLSNGPTTAEQLTGMFPPADRTAVADLVQYLRERHLLVADHESPAADKLSEDGHSPTEVFYWHFGKTPGRVAETLTRRAIAIVGVNRIGWSLFRVLREAGVDNIRLIDYAPLRNLDLFANGRWVDDLPEPVEFSSADPSSAFRGAGCVVAVSDFGGWHLLAEWNKQCLERDLHFMPVLLDNLIGWIGPFVIPGRTACLACLRARLDSNLPDPALRRTVDRACESGKAITGAHPAIADLLGNLAGLELLKFYGGITGRQVGRVIEVNALIPRTISRPVLRIPRCPVCSSLNRHSPPDTLRRLPTVAGNQNRDEE